MESIRRDIANKISTRKPDEFPDNIVPRVDFYGIHDIKLWTIVSINMWNIRVPIEDAFKVIMQKQK